jgi:RHH-type transcriptional regulator, rel operon repressor / antitoxin RelB
MPHSNHPSHPAVTLSVRVPLESRDQLEELASATGRTKSFLAAEAIAQYLVAQNWQIQAIEKSIKKANSSKAKFVKHQKVADWLNSWGKKDEQEPPTK